MTSLQVMDFSSTIHKSSTPVANPLVCSDIDIGDLGPNWSKFAGQRQGSSEHNSVVAETDLDKARLLYMEWGPAQSRPNGIYLTGRE
ncbi:expressed unknown protein [Seminavis robusta]|uniref:Uncharacterized protein n=1 Tax=Seminavis robusta TaxID=568900 RepID=A0A9N8E2K8_9STRA|nr:expressed unknown protein [Seminavis robusta]|eukprot:Sro481_g151670.1 n/a (87) ;mRNA; f:54649-54909